MILAQISPPTISWLAITPEIVLGLGAALVLLVDVQWKPRRPRVLGLLTGGLLALAFGFAILQWVRIDSVEDPFPFAAMIVIDRFGLMARFVLLIVAGLGLVTGWGLFERLGRRAAEALALVLLATAGFHFMAISVHLVLIFLGLEVGSISLYVLAGITRDRPASDEAAIKYFLLGSVASAVFIYGVALAFAGTGQLNLVALGRVLDQAIITRPAVLLIGVALMVVGLAFKVTAAPFHAWAPDVYQGAPAGIVGFMASAAKIGGFSAMLRILFIAFPELSGDWGPVVAGIAALSMVLGAVLAIVQDDIRRMLAYSGVAHAGYILTGVVAGPAGVGGVWFYLAVYTLQLVGAFGVVSAVSGPADAHSGISSYAGLWRRQPVLAGSFAVLLLGMGGLPLTSGFVAKFGVFQAAWQSGYLWLVIVAVVSAVAAFFFYLRVIVVMYMSEPAASVERVLTPRPAAKAALVLIAAATILLGVIPAPLLTLAGDAAAR